MKSKACCTWETFHDGFLAVWDNGCSRKSPTPPRELIDWDLARKHWQRYSMTGGEAARTQLRALSDDVPYSYNIEGGPRGPLCPVIVRIDRN